MSPRTRFIAFLLALLGMAAALVWQHNLVNQLRTENEALRDRIRMGEHSRQLPASPGNPPVETIQWSQQDVNELMRLRAMAARVKSIEQENLRLKSELDSSRVPATPTPAEETVADQDTPEWETMQGAMILTKGLGLALLGYAHGHQGEMPPNILVALESMDPGQFDRVHANGMTAESAFASAGEVEFEMVFLGRLDDLSDRDPSTVMVARQAEPVQLSNNHWARACVFGDGSSRVLVADSLDALTAKEKSLTFAEAHGSAASGHDG